MEFPELRTERLWMPSRVSSAHEPKPRGHCYASEAARAALRFGFERLALPEVLAFTVPHNLRSRRVMERLGMLHAPAGAFDHPRLPEGHPLRSHVLYRLARERWLGLEPGSSASF